jgi:hypothetical protein
MTELRLDSLAIEATEPDIAELVDRGEPRQ